MKNFILLSIIVIMSVFSSFGQQNVFISNYGETCPDFGLAITENYTGGYILFGHSENYGANVTSMIVISIDSIGVVEWYHLYGGINVDVGQSISKTTDGGYILCGFTNSFGAGGYDIFLVKIDSAGNEEWNKTFGGIGDEYGYCVKQTFDNGFVICGSTSSYGAGNLDAILIKTDSFGNEQWSKYFGGTLNDGAYSVAIAPDSGYIIGGYTYNFGASIDNAMIIRTDTGGTQQWLKIYGGAGNDRALSVLSVSDNQIVFSGYTNSFGNGLEDVYIGKTDSSGTLIYDTTYGGTLSEKSFCIQANGNNGFILTGQTESYGMGNKDLYVIETDTALNLIWDNYFGDFEDDQGFYIIPTSDSGFIAIGNTWSYGMFGFSDIFVVKMDSVGNATGIFEIATNKSILKVFPNPTTDFITVETGNSSSEFMISICDINGRVVYQHYHNKSNKLIDVSALTNGVYIITATFKHEIFVGRFVKE